MVGATSNKTTPTVLITTTCRWLSAARLSMALAKAGCKVESLCPPGHPLTVTGIVRNPHLYRWMRPLASFAETITSTKPDLIIPCDDLAVRHLHRLYQQTQNPTMRQLIERSLGRPESFPILYARTRFLSVAKEEKVRIPETQVLPDLDALRNWTRHVGFPTVLKADATSGGEGVRVVKNLGEAERAFRTLQAPPRFAKAAKWALVDREMALIFPTLRRERSVVNAQAYVPGREATSLVACWKGEVLAELHFEVLNKESGAGPATVMRLIENGDMVAAAHKMVRRLHLSGLQGFDFMLEGNSTKAYLIEINPRATQIGHFTLGPGRDLPAALHAAVTGERPRPAPKLTDKDTIALFPGEWRKNPDSPFLRSGYHDVPWEAPDLVRTCVRRRIKRVNLAMLHAKNLGSS